MVDVLKKVRKAMSTEYLGMTIEGLKYQLRVLENELEWREVRRGREIRRGGNVYAFGYAKELSGEEEEEERGMRMTGIRNALMTIR